MAYGLTQSMRLTMASSEYATIADNASLSITGDITIEGWIKIKSAPANNTNMALFIKSTVGASNRSYECWYTNNAGTLGIQFYFFDAGTPTNYYGNLLTYTLTPDVWYHVALKCDVSEAAASKVEWVINGVSQGNGSGANTGSGSTSIHNGTAAFRIGQADPVIAGWYPDAQFSLVRVWSTLRSVSDIATNMCNVLGATTNLQAEWTLDNVYTDNSGNSNTLSGVNTPTFVTNTPSTCATNISSASVNDGDNFIYEGLATTNFSTDAALTIGRNGAWIHRPLMKWTLPSLSGTIDKVTLFLYVGAITGSNTNTSVYEVLRSDMSPSQSTWNMYKTSNNWTTAGAAGAGTDYNSTAVDTTAIPAVNNWHTFDLLGGSSDSPMTINWGDTIDLLLRGAVETGTNYVQYRSKEHATAITRPYIEITYTASDNTTNFFVMM